jgi:hypothetical protein
MVAAIIGDPAFAMEALTRHDMACRFADTFAADNPNFDRRKFLLAVGALR